MRRVALLFFLLPLMTHAQDIYSPSNYEQFCHQSGRIVKTNDTLVGEMRVTKFYSAAATDAETGQGIKAVTINQLDGLRNITIDLDDIPFILKTLDYYRSEAVNQRQVSATYNSVTSGDIQTTLYYSSKKWYCTIAKLYHESTTGVPNSNMIFYRDEIPFVIKLLKAAAQ